MCGIVGAVWREPGVAPEQSTIEKMASVIRHRGPDDDGFYRTESMISSGRSQFGAALGFRRLSIIDLAGGHQPMANEDDTIWIVFNGEIYNYQTIRRRLEGNGHTIKTSSDTEVIVHLYEDMGLDCFSELNGMFAIAIWDSRKNRLVLARDRIGKKPLVYRNEGKRLWFGSELKSLLQPPGAPRTVDLDAVDEYLAYDYVPHPRTILKGYSKLPPGYLGVFDESGWKTRPYWTPPCDEMKISREDAEARLRELFTSAVSMRMRSDVPLGAFLSGGIDSSLVVAVMQKLSDQPIKTFTIGFPVPEYDESAAARNLATALKTEHHEMLVEPNALEALPKMIWNYDEPFADSSSIPTWYLSKLTRQHVTVSLSGDGGDELFAGYGRYRAVSLAGQVDRAPWFRKILRSSLIQSIPVSSEKIAAVRRFKRFAAAVALDPPRRYFQWIACFNEARRADLYREEFVKQLIGDDPIQFLIDGWNVAKGRDHVTRACVADLVTYMPGDLMCKVDIASMAHSLEVRCPFLDYRLVEFACQLPVEFKRNWGVGKQLLRTAFKDTVPDFVWKKKKQGFGVPLDYWFRGELRGLIRDTLDSPSTKIREWFRPESITRLLDEHDSKRVDHSRRLWTLLVLERWIKEWAS